MHVTHEFTVHAACPFIQGRTVWDYYTVTVALNRVVDVHLIERAVDEVRGAALSQEAVCHLLAAKLADIGSCTISLTGKHSSNSVTRCEIVVSNANEEAAE